MNDFLVCVQRGLAHKLNRDPVGAKHHQFGSLLTLLTVPQLRGEKSSSLIMHVPSTLPQPNKLGVYVMPIGAIVTVNCDKKNIFYREYNGTLSKWRVEGYLKLTPKPAPSGDEFVDNFINEAWASHIKRFTFCGADEATHVSLVGVCGAVVEMQKCNYLGMVPWPQKQLDQHIESAKCLEGHKINYQ